MTMAVTLMIPAIGTELVSAGREAEHGLMLKNVPNLTYEAQIRLKRVLCNHRPTGP